MSTWVCVRHTDVPLHSTSSNTTWRPAVEIRLSSQLQMPEHAKFLPHSVASAPSFLELYTQCTDVRIFLQQCSVSPPLCQKPTCLDDCLIHSVLDAILAYFILFTFRGVNQLWSRSTVLHRLNERTVLERRNVPCPVERTSWIIRLVHWQIDTGHERHWNRSETSDLHMYVLTSPCRAVICQHQEPLFFCLLFSMELSGMNTS